MGAKKAPKGGIYSNGGGHSQGGAMQPQQQQVSGWVGGGLAETGDPRPVCLAACPSMFPS
jgi:hypothetical protein